MALSEHGNVDLRRDMRHRIALAIHDQAWNEMHNYGVQHGRDNPEYRGKRAIVVRAAARVREARRG